MTPTSNPEECPVKTTKDDRYNSVQVQIDEAKDEAKWRKRLAQEMDLAGRSPVRIIYGKPPLCPHCGDTLWLQSIKPHWFPYIHVDYAMKCPMCNESYLFGLPMSRDAGLSLHIWDSNPLGAMEQFMSLGDRKCKWRQHGDMIPTKIFGDWFIDSNNNQDEREEIKFQWKCPVCYLVQQEWYPRICDHGDVDPLTPEEKKALEAKLERMGYI